MTVRIITDTTKNTYIRGKEGSHGRLPHQVLNGGKSSNPNQVKATFSVASYIDEETLKAFQNYSKDTHKSGSWIIRDLLIDFLNLEGYL